VRTFFDKYSDGEKIGDEKFEKFFQDIGVDIYEDLTAIYICMKMKVDKMGIITYEQMKNGCNAFGVAGLDKWRTKMVDIKKSWARDEAEFKRAYTCAFELNREDGMNNIETDTCIEMWKMWLPGKCGFLDSWFNFLVNVKKPNVVKKDQWIQFYELCKQTNGDFSKFSDVDDGTWPEIIDDFNEHMNPS